MPADDAPAPLPPLAPEAAERLADVMFALATPSRLHILASLRAGPLTVSQIIREVGMEQSAVSHQLRVLRDHSVVSVERRGRERVYALHDEDICAVLDHAHRHVLGLARTSTRRRRRAS
jgi:ArsR family transcriptional regulator, nickel/cobalt-responsive transcriptional repressor